jgi:hypothetical protein
VEIPRNGERSSLEGGSIGECVCVGSSDAVAGLLARPPSWCVDEVGVLKLVGAFSAPRSFV